MEQEGGSIGISPLQGTYIMGASNATFALLALGVISILGRRTIWIVGQLCTSLSLAICGYCVLKEWNLMAFIFINVFLVSYQLFVGNVAWLYLPEICVDAAAGFGLSGKYFAMIMMSFSFEFMINSAINVHGTIWVYSGINFAGFIFCLLFVKETRGLTDLQKKTLYSPKNIEIEQDIELAQDISPVKTPVKK